MGFKLITAAAVVNIGFRIGVSVSVMSMFTSITGLFTKPKKFSAPAVTCTFSANGGMALPGHLLGELHC